jgi:hypothetical protein
MPEKSWPKWKKVAIIKFASGRHPAEEFVNSHARTNGSGGERRGATEKILEGGSETLYFVSSDFKQKFIEFWLMVSGSLFYHLVLRPKDYFRSRKRKKELTPNPGRHPAPKGSEG